jgi:hypothetical protein
MKTALLFLCLLTPALARAEAITNVNLGSGPNSGNGDPARVAFDRLNRDVNLLNAMIVANSNAAVYFPRNFGAVGDGVTDDTAAIQRALNALTPGSTLDGEAKKYSIPNRTLLSRIPNTKIQNFILQTTNAALNILSNYADNVTVRWNIFGGPTNAGPGSVAVANGYGNRVTTDYPERFTVEDNYITNFYKGIEISHGDNPRVIGNRIFGVGSNAVHIFECDEAKLIDNYGGAFGLNDPSFSTHVGNPSWQTNLIVYQGDGGISIYLQHNLCQGAKQAVRIDGRTAAVNDSTRVMIIDNDFESLFGSTNVDCIEILNSGSVTVIGQSFVRNLANTPGTGRGYMSSLALKNCNLNSSFIYALTRYSYPSADADKVPTLKIVSSDGTLGYFPHCWGGDNNFIVSNSILGTLTKLALTDGTDLRELGFRTTGMAFGNVPGVYVNNMLSTVPYYIYMNCPSTVQPMYLKSTGADGKIYRDTAAASGTANSGSYSIYGNQGMFWWQSGYDGGGAKGRYLFTDLQNGKQVIFSNTTATVYADGGFAVPSTNSAQPARPGANCGWISFIAGGVTYKVPVYK